MFHLALLSRESEYYHLIKRLMEDWLELSRELDGKSSVSKKRGEFAVHYHSTLIATCPSRDHHSISRTLLPITLSADGSPRKGEADMQLGRTMPNAILIFRRRFPHPPAGF